MTFLAVLLATVAAMEAVAWLMHKHLMHGPLWFLHESHHRPRAGWFEKNDVFGLFFSIPSIGLIWFGTHGWPTLLAIGCGMTMYGFLYFAFHDVIVHRRLPLAWRPGGRYMQRIIRAHLIHHKTLTRDGATSFGFLYAPDLDRA